MEREWIDKQKELFTQKILEKIEKGRQQSVYTDKCLQMCNSFGN